MTCWSHPIKAIIFDNDGTFLDTIPLYVSATRESMGVDMTDEFYKSVNGMDAKTVCAKAIEYFDLNTTPEMLLEKRNKIMIKLLPDSKPFPGSVELIRQFKEAGKKVGLATSTDAEYTQLKFSKQHELRQLFDAVVTRDDVVKAKPDPEIFLNCAQKLGDFKPENILVFEDAINGIIAANRAGMATAYFANGNTNYEEDFQKYGGNPSYVFQKYSEFDKSQFVWE